MYDCDIFFKKNSRYGRPEISPDGADREIPHREDKGSHIEKFAQIFNRINQEQCQLSCLHLIYLLD